MVLEQWVQIVNVILDSKEPIEISIELGVSLMVIIVLILK